MSQVEVGTRWRDNDPRQNGRTVTVTHIYANEHVAYRNVTTNRLAVSHPQRFMQAFTKLEPSAPLATSSSPVQHALDALAFAHGAIGDAIGLDEGLDGVAGQKVIEMIDAALRANGRLPPEVPPDDHAVAPTPYWTASIEPASSSAWEPLRALVKTWQKAVSEEDGNTLWDAGFEEAMHRCAAELEALLPPSEQP